MAEQDRTATAPEQAPASEDLPAVPQLIEMLQRERADFQNYRRRLESERAGDRERTRGELVHRLLPVLDELDRALAQTPPDLAGNPWAQGVALTRRSLDDALAKLGVERFGAQGEPFDPTRHDALFYEERDDVREPHISQVIRPGYLLGGRLLQAAQVSVLGPLGYGANESASGDAEPKRDQQGG
jgi:molecular chaperone GrpE